MGEKKIGPGRRFFMAAGLAAWGMAAVPGKAFATRDDETVYLPPPPPPIPGAPSGLDRLRSIMERNDVTLAVDPNHWDHTPYAYIGSDQFLDLAKQANITHVAVEVVSDAQPLIDTFAAGKISKEEFFKDIYGPSNTKSWFETGTEYGDYVTTLVTKATARGIKIIAADDPRLYLGEMNTPAETKFLKAYEAASRFDFLLFRTTDPVEFAKKYFLENPQEAKSYEKEIIEFRSSLVCNNEIVATIDGRLDENSKLVVLFGNRHQNALQEIFQSRKKTVAAVTLYKDADSMVADEKRIAKDPNMRAVRYNNNFLIETARFADDPVPEILKPHPHRGPRPTDR